MSEPRHHGAERPLRVQYSLAVPDAAAAARMLGQLELSLSSLRRTNDPAAVAPVVVVHGTVPRGLTELLAQHDADLETRPPVADQLHAAIGALAPALAPVLTVHKALTLAPLADRAPDRLLLLDCDTLVTGDVTALVPHRDVPTLFAREEIGGTRCRFGEDRAYLDEHALRRVTSEVAGHAPTLAFNTGVVGLVGMPWARAAALQRRYVGWLVRFAVWMALHPAAVDEPLGGDIVDLDHLGRLFAGPQGQALRALAAPYPSANRWLIEEVALWAAVGGESALTHEAYLPDLVIQGAETTSLPWSVVAHYFSSNEDAFRGRLAAEARWIHDTTTWPPGA